MLGKSLTCLAGCCCVAIQVATLFAAEPHSAPRAVEGCVLWLKADAGVLADAAGKITKWLDQSGQGHHVDMVVGTAPAAATGINNRPVVRFDGQGYAHSSYDFGSKLSAHSLFLVARWTEKSPASCRRIYPSMACIGGNTPEKFAQSLLRVKAFLDRRPEAERIFNINAWNEWTEGSYLEPDTINGMGYLAAIKQVFG